MSKIVKFPENRIVRQETEVSFDEMRKFLYIYNLAEESGATFYTIDNAVSFQSMDNFDKFVELIFKNMDIKDDN
jgi:hypothetical protein